MLVLIIKIMVIVVLTSKIVDVVEDKGHRSLWVKLGTPAAWIAGEIFGSTAGLLLIGMSAEAATSPQATVSPELANSMFVLMLCQIGGALAAVGALYLYARSRPDAPPPPAAASPN